LKIWNSLEDQYKGKSQYTIAKLVNNIFRMIFVDTIPIEHQLEDMYEKVHKLKNLGHIFKNSLITMIIIISLLESYVSLQQYLFMKDKNILAMNFVIRQILIDEKSKKATPHIVLIGDYKKKKLAYQLTYQKNNNNARKKKFKCHYCKRKSHFKSKY